MLCAKPFKRGIEEYGCGQCWRCRVNRRRVWTLRLMLEATQHQAHSFVTFTYAPEHLPAGGSLRKRDLQLVFKRFRKGGLKFRYYAVGEYGEQTSRPHYHVLFFGVGRPVDHVDRGRCVCAVCVTWGLGHVHIGHDVAREAIAYCAGYVLNKVVADEQSGRQPQFSVMSRRPGIGFGAVEALAATFARKEVARTYERYEDTPFVVRADGKKWPLGRYLRTAVANTLGLARRTRSSVRGVLDVPPAHVLELWQEMLSANGRVLREERRTQHIRNAAIRSSIVRSRRIL